MSSYEKYLQKTHGSISCYQVHPDKTHDKWYELHKGNWCTIIHPDETHDEYSDKLEQNPKIKTLNDLINLSKPNENFYKFQEMLQEHLENDENKDK